MDETSLAILRSWPAAPWTTAAVLIAVAIYARGWWRLRRRGARRAGMRQLAAMLGAALAVWVALASPLEPLSALLLSAHMAQHMLLMFFAAPLIWLSDPLIPSIGGLPRTLRREVAIPLARSPVVRRVVAWWGRPVVALGVLAVVIWFWHSPYWFNQALERDGVHFLEHVSFFLAALLFWWVVIQPPPAHPAWPRWQLVPLLLLADLQNTVLCGLLAFSNRVLYTHYANVPRLWSTDPLVDQHTAAVLMWVPGSLVLLTPLAAISWQLLTGTQHVRQRSIAAVNDETTAETRLKHRPASQGRSRAATTNLLDIPGFGLLLRSRALRTALSLLLALGALLVVFDGWWGPQVAALNLAGTVPWIHWRGAVVLGLLALGNWFCFACPFALPRWVARHWSKPQARWPRVLRSKWLGVGLLVGFFGIYEVGALWDSPWWTAWIVVGYFLAAATIDMWFQGASFCKYVCPIGQFNFVQSLVSPVQVRAIDTATCDRCTTHDCLRGNASRPGCELDLLQPRKVGNLDCTFCLNCVTACPQQNVGLLVSLADSPLWQTQRTPARERWNQRWDVAALVLVLASAAWVNAAGMTAPVVTAQQYVSRSLDWSLSTVITATYLLGMTVLPLVLVAAVIPLSRLAGSDPRGNRELVAGYALALVPLAASMWIAHYSFHLLTSGDALAPAVNRLANSAGLPLAMTASSQCACCNGTPTWLLQAEIVILDLGLLASLYAGFRFAEQQSMSFGQTLRRVAPWAVVVLVLFAIALWIIFQPMQMRGTLWFGG